MIQPDKLRQLVTHCYDSGNPINWIPIAIAGHDRLYAAVCYSIGNYTRFEVLIYDDSRVLSGNDRPIVYKCYIPFIDEDYADIVVAVNTYRLSAIDIRQALLTMHKTTQEVRDE